MYEGGRLIADAQSEIKYAAGLFDWSRDEPERSNGYTARGTAPSNHIIKSQQPVGVVGVLTAWI